MHLYFLAPQLRYESLMKWKHNWEDYLKFYLHYGQPLVNSKLISMRTELASGEIEEQKKKMVEDILRKWNEVNHIKN